MISVIIPLYNKETQIAQTLKSVLKQTFQDFEIIIVNDGSTDNSVKEVEKINDSRVRLIHQRNKGVSAARNRGMQEARGNLIAFLDADDIWNEDYLKTQYNLFLKYPDCSVFVTNYEFKDSKGTVSPTVIKKLPFSSLDGVLTNYFEIASCSHPPITSITIMIKREVYHSIGGFPQGVKSGEDLLTWARIAIKYKIAFTKKVLATFIFDQTNFNEDQRNRVPEKNDYVGEQLQLLYDSNPHIVGLKHYVALWFKMRSRIYLYKGYRVFGLKEAMKSLKYRFSIKILVFIFLAFSPHFIVRKIFR